MRRMQDLRRSLLVFSFSPVGDAFLKVKHMHVKMSLLALSSNDQGIGRAVSVLLQLHTSIRLSDI